MCMTAQEAREIHKICVRFDLPRPQRRYGGLTGDYRLEWYTDRFEAKIDSYRGAVGL